MDELASNSNRLPREARTGEILARAVLVLAAILPFFDALFLGRSILSFDSRAFPPFSLHAPQDLGDRLGNFVTSDLNGWIVPEAALTVDELRAGRAPLWNPYTLCGQPLLANLAFPAFYPPNLIVTFFGREDLIRGFAWLVVFHLAVAGLFAFAFLRGHGVAIPAALLGGVGVELATWMTTRVHLPSIVATASWFFAILLAIDRIVRTPGPRAIACLALSVGMAALAGFPQLLVVECLGAAIYAGCTIVGRGTHRRVTRSAGLVLGASLGAALGAIHLLPAVDQLGVSLRRSFLSAERQSEHALDPAAFFSFFLPEFFAPAVSSHAERGGREADYAQVRWLGTDPHENPVENALFPGAVLLVVLLACGLSWRRRPTPALVVIAGVGLLLGVSSPWLAALHDAIPGFTAASPKRVLALTCLALPALVAIGLDAALRSAGRMTIAGRIAAITALVAVSSGAILGRLDSSDAAFREFAGRIGSNAFELAGAATLVVIASRFALRGRAETSAWVLAVVAAVELGSRARAFNPTQDLAGQFPITPAIEYLRADGARSVRFENVEGAAASLAPFFGYRCFDGAQPMVTTRFGEYVEAIEPGRFDRDDPRVMSPFSRIESISHPAFLRGAVLNVVVTRPVPEFGLEIGYGNEAEALGVYRQPLALPRVRLVGAYEVVSDRDARLRRLADPALDPRRTVLLEAPPGGGVPTGASLAGGEARIVGESPSELTIELDGVLAPSLLYLADGFAEGWTAKVDGIETPVLPADHAFRAVVIPTGARRVVFDYRPSSFRTGATLTLLAIAIVLLLLSRADPSVRPSGSPRT